MKKVWLALILSCLSACVYAVGPITGTFSVCVSSTSTLSCTPGGGTWTSSNPSVATVGMTSGIVMGMAAGVVTITYTESSGSAYQTFTVNPNPGTIVSLSTTTGFCVGSTMVMSCSTPGGSWSSNNTSIATVGSSSGSVMGVSAGVAVISYTLPTGCYSTRAVTVDPSPAPIAGPSSVCVADSITLYEPTPGGTWTSSPTTIATVSTTGVVTGVSAGVANISYTLSGCRATKLVTVYPLPSPISAPASMCVGGVITVTDATPGGSWDVSPISVATITPTSGVLTALTAGIAIISYTAGGCRTVAPISVYSAPGTITPIVGVACVGNTIPMSSSTPGGTWTSGTTSVATIGSMSGMALGVSAGTSTITYTLAGGCSVYNTVTVLPLPVITGGSSMCAGSTLTLSSSSAGTWSSGSTGIATIGSSTGVVTGVALGSATISLTDAAGCSGTIVVTINPLPVAIVGPSSGCVGGTITLTDASPGGTWTSGTTSVATIGSSSGAMSGVAVGTTVITYTLPTGCYTTRTVSVTTCTTTGVQASPVPALQLLPNPAHNEITIGGAPDGPYCILNELGQLLQSGMITSRITTIDISMLPSGSYYFVVSDETGRVFRRFVRR